MKKIEKIAINIAKDKELTKRINSQNYYEVSMFISDVQTYIKAIKQRRMFCIIDSVSSSGMSRNIHFHSFEKKYYRQYWTLFKVLGYTETKNNSFRISGCGMDMIFHTNYSNIHTFYRLGFIDKKTCERLAQMTPCTF